jgi:hypothetical protein
MKKLLALIFLSLVGYAGFAQAPTSVYWLKSRVDGSIPTPVSGWGSMYYDYVAAKWKFCNGTSCYDIPTSSSAGTVTTRNNLPASTHTSSFTLAPADTSKMHIISGGSGAIVVTLGTFSGLSGKGLQFPFIRDRVDTVYFAAGPETLISFGTTTGISDSTISYLYYNGTTDKFYLANGGSGGGSSGGGGSGTVTSVSVTTANGVSGSVATATTTPAISLTLGAITPTSVNGVVVSGSSTPTLAVTGTTTISGTHSGTSSGTNTGDQTTVTGNAGTATALATSRTIGTLTGDATSAGSGFNGTANNTNAVTLATVNSNVGTFGSATQVAQQTVDAKGRTTAVSNITIIEDAINDGETKAPTENIVYDNLLLKADKSANLTDLANGATALKNIGGIERASVANTQTGTTYTLVAADFSSYTKLYLSNASSQTVTIPLNSVTPIPAGITLLGRRRGAGAVTFTIAGGGTIVSTSGSNLDPGVDQLWALTKREGTNDTWDLDNGGTPLGAANQVLGVTSSANGQEYKTISNGLTAASGTIKLGGALTADTQLSGAFSLGIGASPTSKLHVLGLGTTTGGLALLEDNGGTDRISLLDNGALTHATTLSGTGTLGFGSTITTSSTANSQTLGGFDFVVTPTYGANTGVTLNTFRVRSTSAAADYYKINQTSSGTASSQIWDASTIYDFKNSSSTSIIRNSAAALSVRGGTASTTSMLEFTTTVASAVNNNASFSFTGNTHDIGTSQTRTFQRIRNNASTTSVNGSTITEYEYDNVPSYSIGTSTMTNVGYHHKPIFTAGTFTDIAFWAESGKSSFGQTNQPTAFMDLAASTTASASLRIRSGSAPTSPNDGEIWQDGTNLSFRSGSTTLNVDKGLASTATLDFPSTAAGNCEVLTITVTGAAVGDRVILGIPNASVPGARYYYPTAWVSATNTVTVKGCNLETITALDPASGSFTVEVLK